jgi:asparagine synthetase B (glutamine-hydrolysing)
MPGLIVTTGEEAEPRARRGADAIRREPWERVTILAGDGRVALGFAGEHGGVARDAATGCLGAFDGELLGPDGPAASGDGAADELVTAFAREGTAFTPPEGVYAAAFWRPRDRLLFLLTSKPTGRPLFLAATAQGVTAGGELKALVAAGLHPVLDWQAWAELLAYEHTLDGRTPLEGARSLPAGTTMEITGDGRRSERRYWRYRVEDSVEAPERELVEELAHHVQAAVRSRIDSSTALALSGGLDSRCLAVALPGDGWSGLAATFGAPGSEDLLLGAEVARQIGFRHRTLPFEPGYLAGGAAEVVWQAEGCKRCFHTRQLTLRALRREEGVGALLIGFSGDDVLRMSLPPEAGPGESDFLRAVHRARARCITDELLPQVLAPSLAEGLTGAAEQGLARSLGNEEGDRYARFSQFRFYAADPGPAIVADHFAIRDPLADDRLVEFSRRLPYRLRLGGTLERALLRRSPEVAAVRSPKDGLPPAATGWRERTARVEERGRRAVRSRARRLLGRTLVPDSRGVGDYAADLRGESAHLLDLLLEERTLQRGQLNEEGVRRLVAETLGGKRSHARALGMLLTLELFQRQFLEGERGAVEAGTPTGVAA